MSLVVDAAGARRRLDAFLASQLHWRSRRALVARLERGLVSVNGRPAKKAQRVGLGDVVALRLPASSVPVPSLADLPLSLLFEDAELVVVDKPAGLAVHPASTCPHRHLLGRLAHRYRHERVDPQASPSIIHRLDRDTTGVIAFARRVESVPFYMGQFERRTVRKHYVALVAGAPADRGCVDVPLLARPGAAVVVDARGKPCRTQWEVVARAPGAAMVRVALHTGRKHQIRAHMAHLGHAVLGDDRYGDTRTAAPHLQLHAQRLELDHADGRRLVFDAPLPAAMLALWRGLTGPVATDLAVEL